MRQWLLVLVALGLGCRQGKEAASAPVPRVGAVLLRQQAVSEKVEFPATAMPSALVNVVAKVPGRLKEVKADEGVEVEASQVMAVLDTRDLEIALRVAEGQVAMARAGLEAAMVQRDNLEKDKGRMDGLRGSRSVSEAEAEKVEAAYKAASAQVGVAQAQLKVAEASLLAARRNLEDAVIRAPVGGLIVKRIPDVGQETAPSAGPILVLATVDPLRVEGNAPEAVLGRVRKGQGARVRFDTQPDKEFEGTVEQVGPAVDPVSKTVRVRVSVPNPKVDGRRSLVPGMSAVVSLVTDQGQYFVLPLNAVRREEGQDLVVFLVGDDSRLVERRVRPVRKEGLKFLASDGLVEGERLVVAAAADLKPGTLVQVDMLDSREGQ